MRITPSSIVPAPHQAQDKSAPIEWREASPGAKIATAGLLAALAGYAIALLIPVLNGLAPFLSR